MVDEFRALLLTGTCDGDELDCGIDVSGVNPRAPVGLAGDRGGRAGVEALRAPTVVPGRGRGGNVGDGRPYELAGDMGTELGGPLILPEARERLLAIALASDVVIRDVRLDMGVGGTLLEGNGTPVGKGMALVPN